MVSDPRPPAVGAHSRAEPWPCVLHCTLGTEVGGGGEQAPSYAPDQTEHEGSTEGPPRGKGWGELPRCPLGQAVQEALVKSPPAPATSAGPAPRPGPAAASRTGVCGPSGKKAAGSPPPPPPHMWAGVSRDRGVPGSGEALRRNSGEGRRGLHGHSAWRWPQGRAAGALSRGGGGKRISPRDPWRAEVSQAGPGQVAKGTWPSRRRGRSPGEPLWTFSPPRESLEGKGAEFGEGARLPRGGPCLPWQRPLGHINPPVTPPTPQPGDLP